MELFQPPRSRESKLVWRNGQEEVGGATLINQVEEVSVLPDPVLLGPVAMFVDLGTGEAGAGSVLLHGAEEDPHDVAVKLELQELVLGGIVCNARLELRNKELLGRHLARVAGVSLLPARLHRLPISLRRVHVGLAEGPGRV